MSSSNASSKLVFPDVSVNKINLDLSSFRVEYDQADSFARKVQAFRKSASIPAQNELRNAGYHLLYALTDEESSSKAQIAKGINHCKRASYEAAEAGIIFCLINFGVFKDDYRSVVVSDVLSNWPQIQIDFEDCRTQLELSRQKGDNRSSDYEMHMHAFEKLSGYCKLMDASRDQINNQIQQLRTERRRFVINSGLGLLAIVAAITIAILGK